MPRACRASRALMFMHAVLAGLAAAAGAPPADTASGPESAPAPAPAVRHPAVIRSITIAGNAQTQERVVRMFLKLDTGMVVDSLRLALAEARLMGTQAFVKVKILHIDKSDGAHLYVVLTEKPRFFLADIGGNLYLNLYGEKTSFWRLWRFNVALRVNNLHGRMESLTLGVSFWQWRALWLSWYKPFLPSPYYMTLGGGIYDFPFVSIPWRIQTARLSAVAGRRLADGVRAFVGAIPTYNRVTFHGSDDPGDPLYEADRRDRDYAELFAVTGATADRTDREYPHRRGWLAGLQLGYNQPLYDARGHGSTGAYGVVDGDFRVHQPAWPGRASLAYRAQGALRVGDGHEFHYLATGSESTIRGFGSGNLGLVSRANNRLMYTLEYRFPIFTMFERTGMHLPRISRLVLVTNDVHYRFDGALFVDMGHFWHTLEHPLTEFETAASAGLGLRLVIVPANRAICFDFVPLWAYAYSTAANGYVPTLRTAVPLAPGEKYSLGWHAYVDIQF